MIGRLTLGLILLWAGLSKIGDIRALQRGLNGYGLIPRQFVPHASYLLFASELSLGVLLLSGIALRTSAGAAAGLFILFATGLIISMVRGDRIACHCFGSSDDVEEVSAASLLRVMVMLLIASALIASRAPEVPETSIIGNLMIASLFSLLLRLTGLIPLAWSFFRAQAHIAPVPTRRVSLKYHSTSSTQLFDADVSALLAKWDETQERVDGF